jgi:hypothetical protein
MTTRRSVLNLALLLVLFAGKSAYATNCSGVSFYGYRYFDISEETLTEQKTTWDCWTLSSVGATTLNTYTPGFEIRGLSGYASRSLTVDSAGHYEVTMAAEFIDPHHYGYNQITALVSVYHPATQTTTPYQLYYHNGAQGDDPGSSPYVDIYDVAEGDTITITIQGAWSFDDDSHARFSAVHIFYSY